MLSLILGGGLAVSAQFMPDAPVKNFKLYGFEEASGWRAWQLEGASGEYEGEDTVKIEDMLLRMFTPTEEQHVQLRIESPEALMRLKLQQAEGPTGLVVTGDSFYISGEDWSWDGVAQTLQIERKAHAVIKGDMGALIR